MCLIVFTPNVQKAKIQRSVLERGFDKNYDGAGIAYISDGALKVVKMDHMIFNDFYAEYQAIRKDLKGPLLIHFRKLTKGSKSETNTQPLMINVNLAMAHNGTIDPLINADQDDSDSVHLCRLMRRLRWEFPFTRAQIDLLTVICDSKSALSPNRSKLVFLDQKGRFQIINADLGKWRHGAWYSDGCECFETWQSSYGAKSKIAKRMAVKQSKLVHNASQSVHERNLRAAYEDSLAAELAELSAQSKWNGQTNEQINPAYGTPIDRYNF